MLRLGLWEQFLVSSVRQGLGRLRSIQGLPSIMPHSMIETPHGVDFSFLFQRAPHHITMQLNACSSLRHAMYMQPLRQCLNILVTQQHPHPLLGAETDAGSMACFIGSSVLSPH